MLNQFGLVSFLRNFKVDLLDKNEGKRYFVTERQCLYVTDCDIFFRVLAVEVSFLKLAELSLRLLQNTM